MSAMPTERLLLAAAALLFAVRAVHVLARRIGQPAVVAELSVGILLGLALTGGMERELLTAPVREGLAALGGLGLLLFLFETGCATGHGPSPRHGRRILLIGGASFLVPFAAGAAVAALLADAYGPGSGRSVAFVLFLATALAVTALPVLARIMSDLGLADTRLGVTSIGSAAVCDALAWTVLAVALAVDGSGELREGLAGLAGCALYTALLLTLGRRLLVRLATARGPVAAHPAAALLAAGILLSAWVTSLLGVHAVFGAFLLGFALRPVGDVDPLGPARAVLRPVAALLAPLYFVVSGMAVDLGAVASELWLLGLLGGVALAGKLVAALGAGALSGMKPRESLLLGAVLNTRGVTELVILSIGFGNGLLGAELFGTLTVFALLATALTGPVLSRWGPGRTPGAELAPPVSLLRGDEDGPWPARPGGADHRRIDEHRRGDGRGIRP
ncbi:cation:proton antiporter [Streptomyces sp. NPDC059037]|uniref:cation:proton antiporter n=1 Tax=Streptomyces sp. NPDC059037 TaxID=3346710 RepID=UPI0036AF3B7C